MQMFFQRNSSVGTVSCFHLIERLLFRISHIHSLTSKVLVIKCETRERERKNEGWNAQKFSLRIFVTRIVFAKEPVQMSWMKCEKLWNGCGCAWLCFGKCNGAQQSGSLRNYYNKSFDFSSFSFLCAHSLRTESHNKCNQLNVTMSEIQQMLTALPPRSGKSLTRERRSSGRTQLIWNWTGDNRDAATRRELSVRERCANIFSNRYSFGSTVILAFDRSEAIKRKHFIRGEK